MASIDDVKVKSPLVECFMKHCSSSCMREAEEVREAVIREVEEAVKAADIAEVEAAAIAADIAEAAEIAAAIIAAEIAGAEEAVEEACVALEGLQTKIKAI